MIAEDDYTETIEYVIERIAHARTAGRTLLVFSDYDGTLTETASHPDLARLTLETRLILRRLAQVPGVHVGILSGRSLDDLKPMVDLDEILLAGTSGLELDLTGTVHPPPGAESMRAMIAEAACWMGELLDRELDAWIERKAYGLTIQLANATASTRRRILHRIEDENEARHGRLRIINCALGLEIIPEIGLSKASALHRIREHLQAESALTLYAGNDANDREALHLVNELDGIAIGIGPHAPPARLHFPEPAQFIRLLAEMLEHLTGSNQFKHWASQP